MAWKPHTIFGKILKGAVIGGGTLLGLTAAGRVVKGATKGVGLIGKISQSIKLKKAARAVKGTGALAKVGGLVSGAATTVDVLKESAVDLVTGTTKEQRILINEEKAQTKAEAQKLGVLEKLVRAGATVTEARAKLGLAPEEVTDFEGEPVQKAGMFDFLQNKNVLYIAAALIGLFLFSKRRR